MTEEKELTVKEMLVGFIVFHVQVVNAENNLKQKKRDQENFWDRIINQFRDTGKDFPFQRKTHMVTVGDETYQIKFNNLDAMPTIQLVDIHVIEDLSAYE